MQNPVRNRLRPLVLAPLLLLVGLVAACEVINANNANVTEGQAVQATGTVRAFDETILEQDLGLTFDDNLYDDWDDDHVLVASDVKPMPGSAG